MSRDVRKPAFETETAEEDRPHDQGGFMRKRKGARMAGDNQITGTCCDVIVNRGTPPTSSSFIKLTRPLNFLVAMI